MSNSSRLKSRILLCSCLISAILFSFLSHSPLSKPIQANPVPWDTWSFSDLSVKTDVEMATANVRYDITASSWNANFSFALLARYVLYNPNATQTIVIGFPVRSTFGGYGPKGFSTSEVYFPHAEYFQVNVSGDPVPFIWTGEPPYSSRITELLLFNASLRGHNETIIEIGLQGDFDAGVIPKYITFEHIVFTSNAWAGNKTIIIQYIVWDAPPQSYSQDSFASSRFFISNGTLTGRTWTNYTWYFVGEELPDFARCSITYSNPKYSDPWASSSASSSELSIHVFSVLLLLPLTAWKLKKKRKADCSPKIVFSSSVDGIMN